MLYKDIPGQKSVKKRLLKMANEQRIPHALLFLATDGSGSLPLAVTFAQYVFCEAKADHEPCEICPSCIKVKKLAHPDLHFVFPIPLIKEFRVCEDAMSYFRNAFLANPFISTQDWSDELAAENKQFVIPAEQSNSIIKSLSYTSFGGGYKIMVIWAPEKMNNAAANKLLKILEEPPEQTIFILVCHQADQLLSTIISRTQMVKFEINTYEEIVELLQSKGIETAKAQNAAKLADGNFRNALTFLQENPAENELNLLDHFQKFMRYALKFNAITINSWIDFTAGLGREKQKQFLNYSLQLIRDCLVLNNYGEGLTKSSPEEIAFLKKFAPFVHFGNIEAMTEELNKAFYHVERNANPKILFMDLCLKMNDLLNIKNPQTIN